MRIWARPQSCFLTCGASLVSRWLLVWLTLFPASLAKAGEAPTQEEDKVVEVFGISHLSAGPLEVRLETPPKEGAKADDSAPGDLHGHPVQPILPDWFYELVPYNVLTLGECLVVRGTRDQVRKFGEFLERDFLDRFSLPAPRMVLELDVIRCDQESALRLLFGDRNLAEPFSDEERKAFLEKLPGDPVHSKVVSHRIRCISGRPVEVSARSHVLPDKMPDEKEILKLYPTARPGGVDLEIAGAMCLPPASGVEDSSRAVADSPPARSLLHLKTHLFVPEGQTVVAGLATAPLGCATRTQREVLLVLVRGRTPKREYEGELARGRYFFDLRDILELGPAYRPLLLLQRREEAEDQAEADMDEVDPDSFLQFLMDSTGGDDVWDENQARVTSSMEYHDGLLLVTTPQPAIAQRVRDFLGKLRARPKGPARVTGFWLALDRKAEEALPKAKDDPSALAPEGVERLTSLLNEGKSARLLDAAGTQLLFQDNTGEVGRGDSWENWPGAEGAAGGSFLPVDDRQETGMACVFHVVGQESRPTADLDLLFRARTLTEAAPGRPEVPSLGWANPMTIENGRWYLLSCGPLLGDGRSGTYLLLGGYWKQDSHEPHD